VLCGPSWRDNYCNTGQKKEKKDEHTAGEEKKSEQWKSKMSISSIGSTL